MLKKLSILMICLAVVAPQNVWAAKEKNEKKVETQEADTYELLNLFGEVLERTKMTYVEEVSDQKLIEAAINGMLTSLDPHSSFLDEKSFQYMSEQTKGKFGGLGIEVTMENGVVKVVTPIDDTPAFKAGLKPGDYITNIDNETVIGLTLNDAVEKMRGKIGTKVKLTIRRGAEKPFDVTLKRDEIKIQSVKSEILADDVIYVRISSFNEDTDKMVEKYIKENQKKLKNNAKGIILDVRNNPGGLLDQAVSISDLFLDKGEIVSTRSRNEEDTIKFSAKEGDIAKGLPIVVVINDGSASASEIVAGALQDHKRAVLLGEKSFGKGSVQTVVPLGKKIAMRITTARYYTPSGRSIQAKGIEPDVEVKPAKVEVIDSGYSFSEAELRNALKNENNDEKNSKKEAKDNKKEVNERLAKDYQLSRAVDLVKALGIYGKYDN
ncbi:MAG: S41 family peptidase [Alphaproteobacteria bacterium]|nr:S41 family peptidase [Alphaproteobacteria bacterium]